MARKSLIRFWAVPVLGAVVALASGCHKGAASQGQAAAPPPPVVTVAPAEQREIVEWSEFTGHTEAVEAVEVRPRVSGHIQEVRFQSGQLVRKGDVLFVIDPRWHKAEFERRQAEFEQAKVRLANAEREAGRTAQLLANKAISTEDSEARVSRFQEAKAGLMAAEAARDFAKLDLDFTEVRAPIDGRVSRALLTPGNYATGTAGMTTVLTTIVSVDPIYVYINVDENSLLRFNTLRREHKIETIENDRVPVELELTDENGFPHKGYIESFDNRVDAGTGSILVRTVFPNHDDRLVPGLFARVRLPGSARHSAILVDEAAIGTDQAQKFVFSLTATNTVEYRAVKLGPAVGGKRIIREGLAPGEKIVVNGIQRVRPGAPVTPQDPGAGKDAAKVAQK